MSNLKLIGTLIVGFVVGIGMVLWIAVASAGIGPGGLKMGEGGGYNTIRINGMSAQNYIKLHSPKVISPKIGKFPKKGKHK